MKHDDLVVSFDHPFFSSSLVISRFVGLIRPAAAHHCSRLLLALALFMGVMMLNFCWLDGFFLDFVAEKLKLTFIVCICIW